MIKDSLYINEAKWSDFAQKEKYQPQAKVVKAKGMFGDDNGLHSTDLGIVSGDMLDATMQHKLEMFDKQQTQAILESQDIVKAYNAFIDLRVEELTKMSTRELAYYELPRIMKRFVERYRGFSDHYGSENVKRDLREMFIWESQDPDYIRDLLQARLEYANTTQQLLRKIIEKNAEFLKLSSSQLDTLLNPTFDSVKDMKKAIAKHEDDFIKNRFLADCRSIGAGVLITGENFEIGGINVEFEDYIQDLINYDLVVLAHGNDSTVQVDYRTDNAFDAVVKKYIKVKNPSKEEENHFKKMAEEVKQDVIEKNSFGIRYDDMVKRSILKLAEEEYEDATEYGKGKWVFEYPIKFVDGKTYQDIEKFIRSAKKQGFKKIKLYACNPGSYDLPADLKQGVVFSKRTNFLENYNMLSDAIVYSEDTRYIYELEELCINLCEDNHIDYNDNDYLNECMDFAINNTNIVTEGRLLNALSKLGEICKKVIGAIIGFIKMIISAITGLLAKIKTFLSNKDQRKVKKPIKVNAIVVEDAKLKKEEAHSQEELYNIVQKNMNQIAKEYKKVADKQVKINKQLQDQIEKKARIVKNESNILSLDSFTSNIFKELGL